ncbi:MAG: hypothetical protein M3454_07520 [Actinomycetota bacterium]|nr:hypothetical protein [Actinomycetota bacterium]
MPRNLARWSASPAPDEGFIGNAKRLAQLEPRATNPYPTSEREAEAVLSQRAI